MEAVVLGWPPDGPTLRLDYRRFSYAGKFVMSNTGKAVLRDEAEATDAERGDRVDGHAEDRGSGHAEDRGSGHAEDRGSGHADDVVAAVAFNADRTDPSTLWLRYVTVREDRRGEGLGPWLCSFVTDRAAERGYERVRIAVNNPFAYEALYRAGFAFTGEETGIAELLLERPTTGVAADRSVETYQAGLDRYRTRELSDAEREFLQRVADSEPPAPIEAPDSR